MIDTAKITIKAGDGGDGLSHFKRVKYNAFGGPDGGDGGKGGDVYIKATEKIKTLKTFKRRDYFSAEGGEAGKDNFRSGKKGEDLILKVPLGTVIIEDEKIIADLNTLNEEHLLATGGRGGLGNAHFKSSINKTPDKFTRGEAGEERELQLELKLLSDIGLVGLPSVGKSTLINKLAQSNYKTAEYHFTTLEPNLGVVKFDEDRSLVIADLPGLIEDASKGKGLGKDFLRHIERCSVLVHVLDPLTTSFYASSGSNGLQEESLIDEMFKNYKTIRNEMSLWSEELADKKEIVFINKSDLLKDEMKIHIHSKLDDKITKKTKEVDRILIGSVYTGEGLEELVDYFNENYNYINDLSKKKKVTKSQETPYMLINAKNMPNKRVLFYDRSAERPT